MEIIAQNVRTRRQEFMLNFINVKADIVCMTETWLNDAYSTSEYVLNDYVPFRTDRDYEVTRTGGGCWLLHKPGLKS